MRKLQLCALLLSFLSFEVCLSQANAINIVCDECRDPNAYPEDYANFAFNQIYGPDAWLSFEQADDFFVTNLDNQRVYIDVDYVFDGLHFEGFEVPLWPKNLVQIMLALPNGDLLKMYRSVFQTSLPVPASEENEPDNAGDSASDEHGDSGGGGGEADDDYGDPDAEDHDWEGQEGGGYEGTTSIEDPDENGEFEEPDWCEEC